MSITQDHSHPLVAGVCSARSAIESVGDVQPVYLSPAQKKTALLEIAAAESQLAELKLRVLAASDDLAQEIGARDAGGWLAHATLVDRQAAHADVRLARALDERYVRVAEAMRSGSVNRPQAQVIARALDALPDEVDAFTKRRAEQHLVELAKVHDPGELRRLGARLLEVIAPEIAEEADARALEREEQRARIKASVHFRSQGDGTTRISILTSSSVAARFETYLDAFTSPRKEGPGLGGEEDRLPRYRRLGHAFEALLEHLDPAKLPAHGGDATTVIVTIDETKLREDLATAGLMGSIDGEVRISATEARRLACNANILPAVLNGKGEVLDLGRAHRLFNAAQRKALRLRDKQCRAEGCSIPATWCEAHHRDPWSQGGKTDLEDGVLLCSWHHHRAHDPRYEHTILPTGDWRFHRRT